MADFEPDKYDEVIMVFGDVKVAGRRDINESDSWIKIDDGDAFVEIHGMPNINLLADAIRDLFPSDEENR